MNFTQSFLLCMRDAVLALGLGIVTPFAIGEINELVRPTPTPSSYITVTYEADKKQWEEQETSWEKACKPANRLHSLICLLAGIICLLLALFLTPLVISAGMTLSGVILLGKCLFLLPNDEAALGRLLAFALVIALICLASYRFARSSEK